jgi:ribonuclease R
VHRALIAVLSGIRAPEEQWAALGLQCSYTERRAEEAGREVVSALKCHYMQTHLGNVFDATIMALTHFGFFAELDGVYVEGLVHISTLRNDYYHFQPEYMRLSGERSGVVFHIGQRVRVRVAAVNSMERRIDLEYEG